MIKENIYVAINRNDEIQWVQGSSKKTRYFKTDRYLKGAVEYHNKYHPDDIWEVRKCVIFEDEPNGSEKPNNCDDKPQYDFGEYADRLWKIAYERGKREALEQTEPKTCDNCKLKGTTEWCKRQEVCRAYQPKDEPQLYEIGYHDGFHQAMADEEARVLKSAGIYPKDEPQTERSE